MAAGGLGPVSVPGTLCWEAAGHGQGRPGVSTLQQETPRSQPGPALAPELAPPAPPAARTPSWACARESPRGRVSRPGPNGRHWGKKKWGPAAASLWAEGRPRPRSAWGGRGQRASRSHTPSGALTDASPRPCPVLSLWPLRGLACLFTNSCLRPGRNSPVSCSPARFKGLRRINVFLGFS